MTKKVRVVSTPETREADRQWLEQFYSEVQKVPPVDWRTSKEAAASPDEDEDCGGPDPKK